MRVEMELIRRTTTSGERVDGNSLPPWSLRGELLGWKRLFNQKYRDRTSVGVLVMVFQRMFVPFLRKMPQEFTRCAIIEWSGINALLYYGPTMIRSIGLEGDTVTLIVSGGIGIVQFLAVMPAIMYIDQLGTVIFLSSTRTVFIGRCLVGRKPLLRSTFASICESKGWLQLHISRW
jgi:hypothetical protein